MASLVAVVAVAEQPDRLAVERAPRGQYEAEVDHDENGAGAETLQRLRHRSEIGDGVELSDDLPDVVGALDAQMLGHRGHQGIQFRLVAAQLDDERAGVGGHEQGGRTEHHHRDHDADSHRDVRPDRRQAPADDPGEAVDHDRKEHRQQKRRYDLAHEPQRGADGYDGQDHQRVAGGGGKAGAGHGQSISRGAGLSKRRLGRRHNAGSAESMPAPRSAART